MIRAFLFLLLAVAAGWFVAGSMKQNGPGYVLVYYNHYSVETSVWIGLLALFVLVLICYLLIRLIQRIFHLSWQAWGFRNHKQRQWFECSVDALLADDAVQAIRLATRVPSFTHYLLAGRAALNAGNSERARHYATKAAQSEQVNTVALMLLHYDIEVAGQHFAKAAPLLQQLQSLQGDSPAVLQRVVPALCREERIEALQQLLPALLKKQPDIYQPAQKQWLTQAGGCLINHARQNHHADALKTVWLKLGNSVARNSLLPVYCQALIALKLEKDAEKLLITRLEAQFDPACIVPYAELTLDTQRQLDYLYSMDKAHPFNAAIQLALGIVLLRDQQWDAARKAIEQSIALQPSAEAYRYLSLYYERRGDDRHARQSLLLGLDRLPSVIAPAD